ncbi:MAG: AraC family transcriptional regulator [Planctomycetota bacterium]|nr:AraC family transcriptional regulator [Planctomycetota bacterium]
MAATGTLYAFHTTPPPELAARLAVYSVGHFRLPPGHYGNRPRGWHLEHLHYTLRGSAEAVIAGREFRSGPGSLWFTPKDRPYRFGVPAGAEPWEGLWIEFDGAWVRELWEAFGLAAALHIPGCFAARPAIEELHARLRAGPEPEPYEASAKLFELFALARRAAREAAPRREAAAEALERAQALARQRLAEPLALKDLARAARLSPHHFARLFKARTGFAPLAYVRALRMGRAQDLLRQGGLNVSEVGQAVGYPVVQQFSRVFKQATGMSPRRFVRSLPRKA